MEGIHEHLDRIKIPTARNKVYKDECILSFDTPESETGLYVCLRTFYGFGRDWVEKYHEDTHNSVFLHIRRIRHEVPSVEQGDGPEKKITRLAIGVEGGFDADAGRQKYEYEERYEIVLLPSFQTVPWPDTNLPEIISLSVQGILDAPSASKQADLQALTGTWDGEVRAVSKEANNLLQLDNGKKILPGGWKCEKCDKTDNLWLNLTDGAILCGRKFFDGSGGNNHAVEHYEATGYPLAVKLGTINKDGKADVFSYSENDMVEDPNLIQHLQHWGINISSMEKTEKSMLELELELNQKSDEWAMLQESSAQLKPLSGPGYTGMNNLGNSCYLSSLMQVLFTIPDFIDYYYKNGKDILNQRIVQDPAEDFNIQMAKLAFGLLSGKYSKAQGTPTSHEPSGISPHMFKTLVGKGHPEFSSKRQQDVQEFLLHLLTLLERHNKGKTNPGSCFKFKLEERYQCTASKKVKYLTRSEVLLPLTIPLDAAINKEEVAAYEAKKAEAEAQKKKLEPDSLVRPRIKFFSCLELLSQVETINNFYSTAISQNVTARKTTRLATFPKYLIIQLKKFTLREDWVPIKLDVSIEMPDMLDLSSLRGKGAQPEEELLPDLEASPALPSLDENIISKLAEMGFPTEACKRAVYFTHNSGLEAATAWVMEHIADPDFSDPFVMPGTGSGTQKSSQTSQFTADPDSLATICNIGFTTEQAIKALQATDNNLERAVDWIFSHQDDESTDGATASSSPPPEFSDGDGVYKLVAFISHMGTSSMVGHYVAHILKDGHWVIYNDEKVALSENPPKDLGYLYFYERL